jgi:putative ABC transport system permease protein
MLRITLAQMRRSAGRLAAAGVAIVIGTAFVAATLLAGGVITSTTRAAVSSQYAKADLVVTPAGNSYTMLDDSQLRAIRGVPGVEAVQGIASAGTELSGPKGRLWVAVAGRASDPRLEPADLKDGRLPESDGEVALPAELADRLGVTLGNTVTSTRSRWHQGEDAPRETTDKLTVTGLLGTPSAFLDTGGSAVLSADQAQAWLTEGGSEAAWQEAMVALAPGTALAQAKGEIGQVVSAEYEVLTHDERADRSTAQLTGSTTALTGVVLAFAAVSLLVASLVIANTFQVLVAQRTRTLALLRCVGADRRQLRRSVLTEASIVGVATSAAGVLLGIGLVQATLTVLNRTTDVPLPATVSISLSSVIVPLVVGTVVTLLASLAPARAATRVSPLAALRPTDASVRDRAGKVRAAFSLLLVLGGAGLLALGLVVSHKADTLLGLGVGMLGGAVSFFGVVLGAVFWVPGLLGRGGRLLSRTVAGRLAAANSVRNPRRVATTSGALFIGVTLVVMMSTGAATASETFTRGLAAQSPLDIVVSGVGGGGEPVELPASLADQVADLRDVSAVARVSDATLTFTGPGGELQLLAQGLDEKAAQVLLDPHKADGLADDTVLLSTSQIATLGTQPGASIDVSGDGGKVTLRVIEANLPQAGISAATMARLAPDAPLAELWARVTTLDAAASAVADVQEVVDDSGQAVQVVGAAVERAFYQRVLDTLLAVVIGLLGVAVVIAVVGVANTLSMSVIERRRESATLRAIGLTKAQLRGSLAIEGLLVAAVGTVVGVVLGVAYGWIGADVLLGRIGEVTFVLKWRDLGLVLVVALAAGLLASVLPARSATRTAPVEALAHE